MGMTCHFMARKHDSPQPFEPPSWAYRFEKDEDLPYGAKGHDWWEVGFWWIELGGEHHSIHDTEFLRDELLKIALGVWDHIKNRGDHGAENWAIEWLQFLPAKRESRRYIGDHVLTQGDVEAGGTFDDVVAYGGWPMDDHHPSGFWSARLGQPATIFHPTPSPYGIPYRSLYSKDVDNLMFAGRCASCTHAAMSSTRVMGTASVMGQAIGTAAAIALEQGIPPRGVNDHMKELQQALLADDCYLPNVTQEMSPLATNAKLIASRGDPEPVRDGINRPVGREGHAWPCRPGDQLMYVFDKPSMVREAVLTLDSALNNRISISYNGAFSDLTRVPDVMPKSFHLDGLRDGTWATVVRLHDNRQRLVRLPIEGKFQGIRFVLDETWGSDQTRVYGFNVA